MRVVEELGAQNKEPPTRASQTSNRQPLPGEAESQLTESQLTVHQNAYTLVCIYVLPVLARSVLSCLRSTKTLGLPHPKRIFSRIAGLFFFFLQNGSQLAAITSINIYPLAVSFPVLAPTCPHLVPPDPLERRWLAGPDIRRG